MIAQDDSNSQDDILNNMLGKIKEVERIAGDGDYIFRGEPEHYDRVSSGLYRRDCGKGVGGFNALQREELRKASEFDSQPNELEALTIIQHHGGKTNAIDFTRDHYVALYFACSKSPGNDGRVVFLQQPDDSTIPIIEPLQGDNRVIAQKSVFVQPEKGYIDPNHVVNIPSALKGPILAYLQRDRNISEVSLYNDLHGFIRHQTPLGDTPLPPVPLRPEQEALCRRLDELYQPYNLHVRPSDMFRGAVFASRAECRNNLDWIAQAAHSLREILDPILRSRRGPGSGTVYIPDDMSEVFERYGSASMDSLLRDEVGRVYNRLSDAAHHNRNATTLPDFDQLLIDFERCMRQALTRQLDLHSEIEEIVLGGPPQ